MCPEEEWISLRTTNIIERLNKEFKRRTKSMEIIAGEISCYTLLAFISLKMELNCLLAAGREIKSCRKSTEKPTLFQGIGK